MGLAKYERRVLKQKLKSREKAGQKTFKKANYAIVAVIVLLVGILGYTSFSGYSVENGGQYDSFAKCLSQNAKFYGAYWCPNCQNQKKLFGPSAKYISYIECDPNGENPEPFLCIEKNIKGYPTWEIRGQQLMGVQSLEKLSELSGCKL